MEGQAALLGERLGGGIAISEDVDADQTDDRRHAVAIELEIFEGFVLHRELRSCGLAAETDILSLGCGVDDIHRRAHGEFVEQACGDGVAALRVGQREQNGIVAGLALLDAMQGVEPGVEFVAAFLEG